MIGVDRSYDVWEPAMIIVEDVPGLVEDCMYTTGEKSQTRNSQLTFLKHEYLLAIVFVGHCDKSSIIGLKMLYNTCGN